VVSLAEIWLGQHGSRRDLIRTKTLKRGNCTQKAFKKAGRVIVRNKKKGDRECASKKDGGKNQQSLENGLKRGNTMPTGEEPEPDEEVGSLITEKDPSEIFT